MQKCAGVFVFRSGREMRQGTGAYDSSVPNLPELLAFSVIIRDPLL